MSETVAASGGGRRQTRATSVAGWGTSRVIPRFLFPQRDGRQRHDRAETDAHGPERRRGEEGPESAVPLPSSLSPSVPRRPPRVRSLSPSAPLNSRRITRALVTSLDARVTARDTSPRRCTGRSGAWEVGGGARTTGDQAGGGGRPPHTRDPRKPRAAPCPGSCGNRLLRRRVRTKSFCPTRRPESISQKSSHDAGSWAGSERP